MLSAFFLILFVSWSLCRRLDVVVASAPGHTPVRAARAVVTVVARAAATAATAGRAAVAMARAMGFALDHDAVVVAVVAVDEESEELRCNVRGHSAVAVGIWQVRLTNVTKKVRVRIMARAQLALSIAHVLLMFTAHELPLSRP